MRWYVTTKYIYLDIFTKFFVIESPIKDSGFIISFSVDVDNILCLQQKNAKGENRTPDTKCFKLLLYQLSYRGMYLCYYEYRERGTRTRDLSLPKRAL